MIKPQEPIAAKLNTIARTIFIWSFEMFFFNRSAATKNIQVAIAVTSAGRFMPKKHR